MNGPHVSTSPVRPAPDAAPGEIAGAFGPNVPPCVPPQPSPAFVEAMGVFGALRKKDGIGGALQGLTEWTDSRLWNPLAAALAGAKDRTLRAKLLVPVAIGVTLVFNPILLRQLQADQGTLIDGLKAANNYVAGVPFGTTILDIVQSVCHYPLLLESNPLVQQSRPALVNLAILGGGLAQIFALGYPVVKVFEHVLSRVNRGERLRLGTEPLPTGSRPRVALLGPADFVETVLEHAPRGRRDLRRPVVLVHPEEEVPVVFEDGRVDYHARSPASASMRLVSPSTLDSFGVTRAERVVLVGFNPNKAVFYGNTECGPITPSMCSTYLSILSSQPTPATKNVVLIVPRDAKLLAGTTSFKELLAPEETLMQQLSGKGVKVSVIHPEDALLELISEELQKVHLALATERLNICLIGDKDEAALRLFAKAIEALPFGAKVNILADEILGDCTGSEFNRLSEDERRARKCDLLKQSHVNFVYGSDDTATTDLGAVAVRDAERAIGKDSKEKSQTICIIETGQGCQDARTLGLRSLSIYKALRERVERALV